MKTARRITRNTFSLLVSGVVAQLFAFLAALYLARVLGPTDFGKINFAATMVVYFTLLANMGLPLWGIRAISRDREELPVFFSSIVFMRFLFAIISFSILLVFLQFINKPDDIKNLIVVYGIGIFFVSLNVEWVFQGIEKMHYTGAGRIISSLVYFVLVVALVRDGYQLFEVPLFYIAGLLVSTMFLFIVAKNKYNAIFVKVDTGKCIKILKEALPLGLSIFLIQIIYSIDTLMLGFMSSNSEVGYYNASYKIIIPIIMVGSIFFDAVFPVMSKYYRESLSSLRSLQLFNIKFMSILAVPIAIVGTYLGTDVIILIYGQSYQQSGLTFQILIWSVFFIYLNMVYARGLWACDMQKAYLIIVSGQALLNIGMNYILIPTYGMNGAAFSTVLAEFSGLFAYFYVFNKVVPVPLFIPLARPLLAGAFLLLMASFVKLPVLAMLFSGGVLYLFLLFVFRVVTIEEINMLTSLAFSQRK